MDRNTYIGSSDATDIMAGRFDKLFMVKSGLREREDLSDKFHVQLGVVTEPFHVDWLAKRLREAYPERKVDWSSAAPGGEQHFATYTRALDGSGPLLGSHPDALMRIDGAIYPVECKITGRFRDADEAADFYMPQLQHHMLCWNVSECLFSLSRNCTEPERIWIGASESWQNHYLDACDEFWAVLRSGERPAPNLHDEEPRKVPQPIRDSVPFDGMRRQSITENNYQMKLVGDIIQTKSAHDMHAAAKDELKSLVPADVRELYDTETGFAIKRDKRGALRFTIPAAIAAE